MAAASMARDQVRRALTALEDSAVLVNAIDAPLPQSVVASTPGRELL